MKAFKNIFLLVVVGCFILVSCHKDDCEDRENVKIQKDLPLHPSLEVPPVPPNASSAYGFMNVSYNKCSKTLSFSVTWNNLTGEPIGSHIHGEAPEGENAEIRYDFTSGIPKTESGTFIGSVLVDEINIKEAGLLKGLYYLNIHTPDYPGGEIRGQIEFD